MGQSNSCLRVKAIDPIKVSALQKSNSCLGVKAIDPANMKRTAKNKLLPRSQQNRLQIRRSQKSKSTCLKVTEIDLYKVEHCKKNKFASRSPKSTSIRRALQKSNLPQGHRNRPHQSRHPKRGRIKIQRRA